ncbi:DnaJ domain-containing protein [Nitratireductor sp. ZSWI3]|uniref:DnaJ domain-containing protein n=1 Tax=Nitratireductor sp. ZSWI3 TaxID=2966359 RepID=UPI00214F744E|nr:DnaJ domain-containing protein [Nitratireductor sp. ZSWI3]MCR4267326.1 DnaJ domain-containing protein [Nitratireductor sp. ZSWI3]
MIYPFFFFALVLVLLLGVLAFLRADPKHIAGSLRLAGPLVLGLLGGALLLFGRAGLGGMLLSAAVAWYGSGRIRQAYAPTPGQKSHVRSAALEMELDHDSGRLSGAVLAGRHEGKQLGEMELAELLDLHAELVADDESRRLLETYLDGEFPVWREGTQANEDRRQGAAPGSGPMSEEEAYEVLGLERGASVAEIRKAHRRLMQRLHPDMGGSSFLAARINEARDVLLSSHH